MRIKLMLDFRSASSDRNPKDVNVALQASQIANRGIARIHNPKAAFWQSDRVLSESVSEHGRESVVYTISAWFLTFEVVHKK
jgi:hypothetical protein